MTRIVLDTNIIISSVFWRGNPYKVIRRGLLGEDVLRGNNVPFQVCPLDVTTMRDGRFNPFTDDFYDYFRSEGQTLVGPDYRSEMVFKDKNR